MFEHGLSSVYNRLGGSMHVEERAQSIQSRIEAAFADVPMPSREAMAPSGSLDERWCAEELAGRPRDEVSITDALPECLAWMPPPAVHYYFPMFLLHLLAPDRRSDSFVLQSVIGYLDRRNRREYPPFSVPQRRCIVEWLEFVRDNIGVYDFGPWEDRYERRLRVIRDQWAAA